MKCTTRAKHLSPENSARFAGDRQTRTAELLGQTGRPTSECRRGGDGTRGAEHTAAQAGATFKLAADLRAPIIDGAKARRQIERQARAVTVLVEATHAGMLDDEFLRHVVHSRHELDEKVAALAATGAGGNSFKGISHWLPAKQADTEVEGDDLL